MHLKPSKNRNGRYRQEMLATSLRGIGDVLVYETRRKSNTSIVEEGLKQIKNSFSALLRLKYDNPQSFQDLFFDPDVLNRVRRGETKAAMLLDFQPERTMI